MSEQTGVTKRSEMAPDVAARIAENKARNAVARAIRGTQWGKDLGPEGAHALAEYCRANNLDPVRHIEVLGGRPYLTSTYYEERGAPLVRAGVLVPHEVDFIQADARLDALAEAGDEWATGERTRRMRLRIHHGAPEKAAAVAVKRITVASTGHTVVGVNWCGGGVRQRDPVGDAEPTKTAETRAARRAWKQLAEVVPEYAASVKPAEQSVERVEEAIVEEVRAIDATRPKLISGATAGATVTTDAYGHGDDGVGNAESLARVRQRIEADGLPDPYGVGEAA
jgi:hypothetical protein